MHTENLVPCQPLNLGFNGHDQDEKKHDCDGNPACALHAEAFGSSPINATGYCAVGLAHTLFCDGTSFGHMATLVKALGLKPTQFRHIQQVWNDSPLTFPEIADRIQTEMFA